MLLLTGGAGFIGTNFVYDWLMNTDEHLVNLDALTYAGNLKNLNSLLSNSRHHFVRGNICNKELIDRLLSQFHPRAVVHCAAETHVDRSIQNPAAFIKSNIEGTFILLEATYSYWKKLPEDERRAFRFIHISTDEVYGSLAINEPAFTEEKKYEPNSPYSASKAASDHLVHAWYKTYGLPVIITHCSNNYGPYQHTEKLIPLMINNALKSKPLPIYGKGSNIRDWLYVSDHCKAICKVLERGQPGEVYNIGGLNEVTNLDVAKTICCLLQEIIPDAPIKYHKLITFVEDRPGHDFRYAMNTQKIETLLNWRPMETFENGLRKTLNWYLQNLSWFDNLQPLPLEEYYET